MGVKTLSAAQYLVSNSGKPVTPMRLLKLLYVAHGYSLGLHGVPLLDELVFAWQYGPIVPGAYQAVREFRSSPVTWVLGSCGETLSDGEKAVLDRVLATYDLATAIQLSAAMHQPGSPWSIIWGSTGHNTVIPDELIKIFYEKVLNQPTHSAL